MLEVDELTAQESHALKRLSQLCHYCFDLLVAKMSQQHLRLIAMVAAKDFEQLEQHEVTMDLPFQLRCQLYVMTSTLMSQERLVPLVCWTSR